MKNTTNNTDETPDNPNDIFIGNKGRFQFLSTGVETKKGYVEKYRIVWYTKENDVKTMFTTKKEKRAYTVWQLLCNVHDTAAALAHEEGYSKGLNDGLKKGKLLGALTHSARLSQTPSDDDDSCDCGGDCGDCCPDDDQLIGDMKKIPPEFVPPSYEKMCEIDSAFQKDNRSFSNDEFTQSESSYDCRDNPVSIPSYVPPRRNVDTSLWPGVLKAEDYNLITISAVNKKV